MSSIIASRYRNWEKEKEGKRQKTKKKRKNELLKWAHQRGVLMKRKTRREGDFLANTEFMKKQKRGERRRKELDTGVRKQ